MNLVTRLSPPERLAYDARQTAEKLADAPPQPVSLLKRALREGGDMGLNDALNLEARLAAQLMG